LLSVRPRSRRELELRLLRAGFQTDEVLDELDRLETVGLVDDATFARDLAEHEVSVRGVGRRAVVSSLAAKGVDRAIIDRTLDELPPDDEPQRALGLARSRAARMAALPPQKAYGRLVPFLLRRGYGGATARWAAAVALGLEAGGPEI
jgi:regulatory protein